MFQLSELVIDISELRDMGLNEMEVCGYIEMFLENYDFSFRNAEVV